MSKQYTDKLILLFFVLFPLVLRFWGVADIKTLRGDEGIHVPAAEDYALRGHLMSPTWYHPPLRSILLYSSVKALGNNPYGWRMANVLLGAFSVLVLFLLSKVMFPDMRIAYLSGLLLALDPLHVLVSRSTFEEIPAVFFFLVSTYTAVKYLKGEYDSPLLAGIFLGLATAIKWYYILASGALLIFVFFHASKDEGGEWWKAVQVISTLVFLPAGIYLLSFFAWFGRGYGFVEFAQLHLDALREQQALTPDMYKAVLAQSFDPWEWFVRPALFGFETWTNGRWSRFLIFSNNPPLWMLLPPALAYGALYLWKHKSRNVFLVLALFASVYFQFLPVRRPIFLYSALSVIPFAYLLIAFFLVCLVKNLKGNIWYCRGLLAVISLWGLYFYPLATNKPVPVALYSPLLEIATIFRGL